MGARDFPGAPSRSGGRDENHGVADRRGFLAYPKAPVSVRSRSSRTAVLIDPVTDTSGTVPQRRGRAIPARFWAAHDLLELLVELFPGRATGGWVVRSTPGAQFGNAVLRRRIASPPGVRSAASENIVHGRRSRLRSRPTTWPSRVNRADHDPERHRTKPGPVCRHAPAYSPVACAPWHRGQGSSPGGGSGHPAMTMRGGGGDPRNNDRNGTNIGTPAPVGT